MQLSDQIAASPELMREFQKERLVTEIGELISRIMREKKITRKELADRLGTSRPFVTKLLRSGSNMTARTLADVFFALGYSLRVVERPLSVFTPVLRVTEFPIECTTTAIVSHSVSIPRPKLTATGGTLTTNYQAPLTAASVPKQSSAPSNTNAASSPTTGKWWAA